MLHKMLEITAGEHSAPLYTYILDSSPEIGAPPRPLVLLCPGGGYGMTSDREAEPVAMKLLAAGINVCILRYTVAPARFPTALEQAAKAIALIREHSGEWNVNPDKIIVMGFSAGGHLAASVGTLWARDFLSDCTGLSKEAMRPNGMLLCYPVITSDRNFYHGGSFENLLGDKSNDEAARTLVSLEQQVSADTPPTFLWHTWADDAVPVENSLMLMSALAKAKIPCEAHIFPQGNHGLSLGIPETDSAGNPGSMTTNPEITCWIDLAAGWIKRL